MQISWSLEAVNKVQSIRKYLLEEWSEDEVNSFLMKLMNFEKRVVRHPKLYPASLKYPSLRKAVISKHQSVIYGIDREIIRIYTILDHRQNKTL